MAEAPLRRGGSEPAWVESIAKGVVVVILRLTVGKEVILGADNASLMIEKDDCVLIDYHRNPEKPTVEVSQDGKIVYSEAISVENINFLPFI